jgi:hypothetical protein
MLLPDCQVHDLTGQGEAQRRRWTFLRSHQISIGPNFQLYYNPTKKYRGKELKRGQGAMVPFSLFLGIFFISAATLTLEITLTRLLSVAQWHHFAFMVVSMALLGYGASGAFLSSFSFIRNRENFQTLVWGPLLFSCSTLLAYMIGNFIPFDIARISWDHWQIFYVFLYYLIFSIPFFFSGLTISSALARWSPLAGNLYFFDLLGAALGCVLVLGLFGILGGPGTLLFSCLLGGLASLSFGWKRKTKAFFRLFQWAWIGLLFLFLLWEPFFLSLRLSPYKGLSTALLFPGARLLETHWNAFSRVDILESPAARTAPGLSLTYPEALPPQLGLTIDGDRLNAITHFRRKGGEKPKLPFLDFLPSSFPYQIVQPKRVLIFEPLGGMEVLTALHHQAEEIVAVEVNPTVVDLLQGRYRDYSGEIYLAKEIKVIIEDGRSFVRRNPPPFDLITLPLTESLGASATGLASLHEDYRLTAEAFLDYLQALKPGGFLTVSLYLLPPPRAELRLIAVAKEALERMGKNPGHHLLAFRSWGTLTLLIKREAVVWQESQALRSFCRKLGFDLVYYPGMDQEEANIYNRFHTPIYFQGVQRVLQEGKKFYEEYPFDLRPATDDRPFFHHYFRWGHLGAIYRLAGEKWPILIEGGYLVPVVFFLALFLSLLFIVLPVMTGRHGIQKQTFGREQTVSWLTYFASLGLGFMFVEISLIQKLILFLGHPVYSVSLVIFSLLLFAGCGSRLSLRMRARASRSLKFILPLIITFLFLYALLLPKALSCFQGQPLLGRQGLTLLLIGPLGFLMGIPFPMGIRLIGERWPTGIPWAWCVNGCASVLGSILPVIIALTWGFQAVFFLSALIYGVGFLMVCKSDDLEKVKIGMAK